MAQIAIGRRVRVITTEFDRYSKQSGKEGVVLRHNDPDITTFVYTVDFGHWDHNNYREGDLLDIDIVDYKADQEADQDEDLL